MKAPTFLHADVTLKPDGVIEPTMIYWMDGTPYTIGKVIDIRPGASLKHGGARLDTCAAYNGTKELYLW